MRRALLVLTLVAVVAALGAVWFGWAKDSPLVNAITPESCTAKVNGYEVSLDTEQSRNAALISAVAVRRGLPARAVTIALAAAMQESKLYNLTGGDRDSLGLFQQRPSQGWGTRQQIRDPYYATNRFYDALQKLPDYRSLAITVAAQEVQHSGYPEAYAQHEKDARALASALTGNSRADFWCTVHSHDGAANNDPGADGLTPRAETVRADLERAFGSLSLGGFAPAGVRTGHMTGSAHYEGRAIDIFVRPIDSANKTRGWAIASYLVAHASDLDINTVIFDDRIWRTGAPSADGWTRYTVPAGSKGDRRILEHRDHVHVDVAA